MTRTKYREVHRLARLGAIGTLMFSMSDADYQSIALPVFDLRLGWRSFSKHPRWPRTFDSLRQGVKTRHWKQLGYAMP